MSTHHRCPKQRAKGGVEAHPDAVNDSTLRIGQNAAVCRLDWGNGCLCLTVAGLRNLIPLFFIEDTEIPTVTDFGHHERNEMGADFS